MTWHIVKLRIAMNCWCYHTQTWQVSCKCWVWWWQWPKKSLMLDEDAISQLSSGCCWALGGTRIIRDRNTRDIQSVLTIRDAKELGKGVEITDGEGIVVEGRKEVVGQLNLFRVNLMGLHNFGLMSFQIFTPFWEHWKYKTYWWASCQKKEGCKFFGSAT